MAATRFFLLMIMLVSFLQVSSGVNSNESRLINDLLNDYIPDARPVKNASQKVIVKVILSYHQLKDVDEPSQVLDSLVWMNLHWEDEFLRWNKSDYGGLSSLHLNPTKVWTPDIQLTNNAKEDHGHISSDKIRVAVDSAGRVSWFLTKVVHSACPIDVTRFPFDSQKCVLRFGSQSYNVHELDIQLLRKDGIALTDHRDHSQWKLKSITTEKRLKKYVCCPESFVDILYTFELERKSRYYIITIIVPSMFLCLLASVSFFFPPDSGERVSLVMSVFLGFFVFMIVVNERTPVTSDNVPTLTKIFTSIVGTTVLCLAATAFILHLKHITPDKVVPGCFEKIRNCIAGRPAEDDKEKAQKKEVESQKCASTRKVVSCCLKIIRNFIAGPPPHDEQNQAQEKEVELENVQLNEGASDKVVSECSENITNCIAGLPQEDEQNQAQEKGMESQNVRRNEGAPQSINMDDIRWTSTSERKLMDQLILLHVELKKISEHVEEEKKESKKKQKWYYTLKFFDRLFSILFIFILFVFIMCLRFV